MKRVLAATLGLLLFIGCASLPLKQKLAVTLSASVDALAAFQTTERNLYASKALPALTPKAHENISVAIGKAADAQIKTASVLIAWRAGDPIPATITQTLQYGQQTYEVVATVVPRLKGTTDNERRLVAALQAWLDDLVSIAKSFNLSLPAWAK